MPVIYDRVFKVPTWFVLKDMQKVREKTLIEWMQECGCLPVEWPSNTFMDTLRNLRKQGWSEEIPEAGSFTIGPELLVIAVNAHIAKFGAMGGLSGAGTSSTSRLNRTIMGDREAAKLFDIILDAEDPISVSRLFQIGERCHDEYARVRYKSFVTATPCNIEVLTKLSDRVIVVGDGGDIDTKNLKLNEIKDLIAERLQK